MNRAFYIVIAPAVLVAAAYLGMNYGQLVPLPVALAVGALALVAMGIGLLRRKPSSSKSA
jgi:VIT1/CCC1 family predicted Fe2+/Mn2+ transporter